MASQLLQLMASYTSKQIKEWSRERFNIFAIMKLNVLLFLSFFTGVTAFGQDYFPIDQGTKWTYGSVRPSTPNMTMYIGKGEIKRNGKIYFQMKTLTVQDSTGQSQIPSVLLRKGKKGNVYGINLAISDDEYLFFPGKPEAGYSWTGLSGLSRVTSTRGMLQTPSGQFENCVVIESVAGTARAYTYYQENIGMVGMKLEDRLLMYLVEE